MNRIDAYNAVHPRLRGELLWLLTISILFVGSSPLTRGTRHQLTHAGLIERFIPAYAGNSHGAVTIAPDEHGSSPLTRGTQYQEYCRAFQVRFIPAYAGNSSKLAMILIPESVHPRLRGELVNSHIVSRLTHGSSPLTRGTPALPAVAARSIRFIPAYAGNSITSIT